MAPPRTRPSLRAVALAVLLASCGPKAPPPPPAAAAPDAAARPAAPAELGPPTSPLELRAAAPAGAAELPPLSGAVRELDMVTLTSSTQTFTIDADTAMFSATDPRVAARLQAAFQYDPRWRVGLWEGQTVAWARRADAQGWAAPWGGYRAEGAGAIRTLFRFDTRPPDHPWSASGLVARNPAGTHSMQVMAWKVDRGPWADQTAAAFTIDGEAMSLEVHEVAPKLTLAGTQKDLQQATLRTKAIADQVGRGDLQRTALAMVPKGEPRIGDPFVQVTRTRTGLDVRGRVNPGAEGWLFVRVRDADGRPWQPEAVAVATAERVGWDANPAVVSYFQSDVPAGGTPPLRGTVELWFHPDAAGPLRRLEALPFEAGPPAPPPPP